LLRNARSPAVDEAMEFLIQVIAPLAPHLADELWEAIGGSGFLFKRKWPTADADVARADEITLIVQINGKVRDRLVVNADASNDEITQKALLSPRILELLDGATPKKVIPVAGKLVNIVI
jgi:leucyl-tRNA synthetase